MYLMDVHLIGVYLIGLYHRYTSHRREPGHILHGHVSYGGQFAKTPTALVAIRNRTRTRSPETTLMVPVGPRAPTPVQLY
jgi:hypothetical protein